ncbi:hypothetical protein CYMTET_49652 [Cymbomonas tetramitiformis]|uniref:Uncharacterized protein n=1 Tax=Cymbomonas tetramitiformis TaxID=36881 RepID=A0AAE0BPV0_9CHLO|nr:hypothetical protein CYMTET_49652 [Cymbomonas tetramitiformis]
MWRLSPAVFAIDSSLASGCFGGVDVCGCGELGAGGAQLSKVVRRLDSGALAPQAGTPVLEEAAVEAECTPLPVASAPRGRGCGKWRLWAPESLRVPEEVPAFGRRGFGTCQPTRQKELSKAGFRLVALVRRSELTRSSSVAEPLLSRDDATWHLSALLPEDGEFLHAAHRCAAVISPCLQLGASFPLVQEISVGGCACGGVVDEFGYHNLASIRMGMFTHGCPISVEGASSSMPWSVVLVRALMIVEGAAFVLLHTAAVEERQKVIAYGNATPHKQAALPSQPASFPLFVSRIDLMIEGTLQGHDRSHKEGRSAACVKAVGVMMGKMCNLGGWPQLPSAV